MSAAQGELYLPTSLIEEMAEQRAREAMRAELPVSFHSNLLTLGGLGKQPSHQSLLEEVKGWSAIALRAIADRVQSLEPLVFLRRRIQDGTVEDEQLDDHPLKLVLDKPGPIFSRRLLLRLAAYHLMQTGEAYWQKVTDGIGVTRELWPMPPQNVKPIPSTESVIAGYEVSDGRGGRTFLHVDDVIRIWMPDPLGLYTSMGVLGPQATEWDALRFRDEHLREHFKNDATPRVAIVGQANAIPPTPETRDAFYTEWRQRYHARLGANKGVPAFIPPGFQPHEFDAHGGVSELVPLGDRWRDQVLMAYGVPRSIVGDVVDANRAAAETNAFVFDRHTIKPVTDLISEALTVQLAKDFDPALFVAFEDFVAPDKDHQLKREAQDLALKVRSVQQVRADRGMDPEAAPWGELPVGSIADEPYDGTPADLGFGGESAADLDANSPRERSVPRADGDTSVRAAWERVLRTERKFVGKFERAMGGVFEVQRRETIKRLRAKMRGVRVVTVGDLFDPEAWRRLFEVRVEPLRKRILTDSATEALALVNPDLEFHLTPELQASLDAEGARTVTRVNATTKAFLSRQLVEGTGNGESVDQLAKRINGVFRNRKRSRTIARTEVLKANQQGQLEGFRSSGVVEEKRWNTSLDAKVRDSHQIDGSVAGLGESFTLRDGVPAAHPGDPSLPAGDVVNCRCFLTPVREE